MRRVGTTAFGVGLALLTAGCNWTEGRYFREGVGTELYTSELVASAPIQEVYLGYICQQAGLTVIAAGDALQCSPAGMGPREWTMVVQAGLNDIDQRCDAYLAWLDNKRRSAAPILQQIHDMRTATEAIMRVSGLGADPIVIAGTAFGLASATFTNIQSRLLLEVNHATVQTIVLTRQKEYRQGLMRLAIENRPAAVHALRSYLRICMPFTIETEINNTVTLAERGGPSGIAAGERNRLVSTSTIAGGIIRDAEAPIQRVSRRREELPTRFTEFERSLSPVSIRRIQNALCVSPTGDLGPSGSATRNAIREYLDGRETTPGEVLTLATGLLVNEAVAAVGDCTALSFTNSFEVAFYGVPKSGRQDRIKGFQRKLNDALAKAKVPAQVDQTGFFDPKTRAGIEAYRKAVQRTLPGVRNQQIDRALNDDIIAQ